MVNANHKSENSEISTPRKTLRILEERDKARIKDIPPNFRPLNYIRYHYNEFGKLNSKE